jgi:hypothetical protein
MQIEGFLGTRADFIVDTVMVVSAALPFLLYLAIRLAKKEQYEKHKWAQIALFTFVNILVVILELDIRFGGLDAVIAQSHYYNTSTLATIFLIHIFFAISSTLFWFWLIFVSVKRYPVHFRFPHKKYAIIVFIDIVLTTITGWILYALVFAR